MYILHSIEIWKKIIAKISSPSRKNNKVPKMMAQSKSSNTGYNTGMIVLDQYE